MRKDSVRQVIFPGQYVPGRSFLHSLTPQSKIVAAILLGGAVSVANSWLAALIVVTSVVLSYVLSRLGWQVLLGVVRPFFLFAVLALAFGEGTGGTTLIALGGWRYTTADVSVGLMVALRLLLLISAAGWLAATTPPTSLVDGVNWLMMPLSRLGVPVNDLAVAIMLSLRFLPIVGAEAKRLSTAQAARGVELVGGWRGFWLRLDSLVVPLFAGVIRRSDALAEALTVRGYRRGDQLKRVTAPQFRAEDLAAIAVSIIIFLLAAVL